ncbi:NAD-dependent succinate-semialdehyde dehydrogenase [Leekyejoonella antrihumi]|uniref:NAD-dependent succinate-semialdehyde dehydrogenase n=1 Tax=Leekyejoonella antrihumi TaxID=1660198 RepID=A0A563DQR3_9MICO|nr:NAD-dependent succinate-semialdehyde dehydrogenase [Leekyejoonella antrihumi]TWP32577.1 NAD-dependent succinate-semialdehyde dehydrogenase [Leekyejoonella antrihumi]
MSASASMNDVIARLVTPPGPAGSFEVRNPSDGTVIAAVPRTSTTDLAAAISAAHRAGPGWATRAPRERSEVLRRAFELMITRKEDLAYLMSLEMGKSLSDARSEATYAAEFFRWFAEEAVRIDGALRSAPSGANRILTFRRPVGVALLVTPWNFPAAMATRKLAPALAAGCSVVVKPAQETPLTVLLVAQLLTEAGVPPGVVNVVMTDRASELVTEALADPRVRKLSFTGSSGVGTQLLKLAADRIVNASMELGGNAPFVVLDDADLDAAVEGAMLAKIRNGGQACTAANRFLVQQDVADQFAAKLAKRMGELRVGAGTDEDTQLGPMVNAKALTGIADKVDRSVAAGAHPLIGGVRLARPGFFYPATVLTDVPRDSPVATEEVFGPVAPIIRVRDEDDALTIANSSELGLAGYVYTRDLARGLRVSERLEVGMVGLNRGLISDPAAPFGGVKQSGLGREGGYEGINEYLETKYVATDW